MSVDLLFTQLICCCTLLDVTAHFTSSSCGRQWLLSASEDCSIRKWEVSTLFPCEERLLSVAVYRYRQVGVSLFGAFAILSNPWLGKSILEIDFHTLFEVLIVFSIERCPSPMANTFSACVASDIVLLKSTRGLDASSCNKNFGQILKYSTSSVVDPSLRKRSVTKFTPFRSLEGNVPVSLVE